MASLGTRVQAKLTVSVPVAPYEHEADRVADQLMRMPDQPTNNNYCDALCGVSIKREGFKVFVAKDHESPKVKAKSPSVKKEGKGETAPRVQFNPLWYKLATRAHSTRPGPEVELHHRTERFTLSATVRQPTGTREADGPIPDEVGVRGRPQDMPPMTGEELAEGETVYLPVNTSSYPPDGEADSISANLTYSPSVTLSPDEPKTKDDFGYTWGNHIKTAAGGKIHENKNEKRFEVTQTYENPIIIKVYKDTGPHNQTNITSENDPDIKAGNYVAVAANLTPGTDNRPPRHQFWARDLTLVHEQFHATDGQQFCKKGLEEAKNDLEKQTASTMDEVKKLLHPITDKIVAARAAGMKKPDSEDRAYKNGAPLYKARADKILALGKAGKYTAALEPFEPMEPIEQEGPGETRLAETGEFEPTPGQESQPV